MDSQPETLLADKRGMKVVCAWCQALISQEEGSSNLVSHGICSSCQWSLEEDDCLTQSVAACLNDVDAPVLVVDQEGRVVFGNQASQTRLSLDSNPFVGLLGGEVMACVYASWPGGCGHTSHCSGCTLRRVIEETMRSGRPQNDVLAMMTLESDTGPELRNVRFSTRRWGKTVQVLFHEEDNVQQESESP
jgi:transcriptional regulator with PAS, ATPase and Fis domain